MVETLVQCIDLPINVTWKLQLDTASAILVLWKIISCEMPRAPDELYNG